MDIKDIRESGILESYVIGDITPAERLKVEQHLKVFPELKNDIYQIGAALEAYAQIHGVMPSAMLKGKIMEQLSRQKSSLDDQPIRDPKKVGGSNLLIIGLLSLACLALAGLWFTEYTGSQRLSKELDELKVTCDSIQQEIDHQYASLDVINDPGYVHLGFTATDKYANTALLLLHNIQEEKNYLHIKNLPDIDETKSFQLWSLKANQAPIPLTVFQGDEDFVIPLDFEIGTATYAITIEERGGAPTPNLEDLIATVPIS